MLKQYECVREQIRDIRDGNYCDCINLCNQYLESLSNYFDLNEVKDDLYFIYHHVALCSKKLDNYVNAKEYGLKALECINTTNIKFNSKYANTAWLLALCYENECDNKAALRMYIKAAQIYKNIGSKELRIYVIFNCYKMLGNIKRITSLIEYAGKHGIDTGQMKKELDYMQTENKLKEVI